MREPQNLGAIFHPLGIAMMAREYTATKHLGNIVGFPSVYIPRFVTWGNIGKILVIVDLLLVNWYCE
jgi:hypothetical protein